MVSVKKIDQGLPVRQTCLMIPNSEVDFSFQQEIIKDVVKQVNLGPNQRSPFDQSYEFWIARSVRHLNLNSIPEKYRNQKCSQLDYLFRHHPQSEWTWSEDFLSEQIKLLLQPYLNFFLHPTRVKIHLQVKNSDVFMHRDLSAGQKYFLKNELSTELGPKYIKYRMYPWVDLSDFELGRNEDSYCRYSLKIPISENRLNYGLQFIAEPNSSELKKYRYTTNGNVYFLDESEFHGAEHVNHIRGLVFVDGILNPEVLKSANLHSAIRLMDER